MQGLQVEDEGQEHWGAKPVDAEPSDLEEHQAVGEVRKPRDEAIGGSKGMASSLRGHRDARDSAEAHHDHEEVADIDLSIYDKLHMKSRASEHLINPETMLFLCSFLYVLLRN